MDVGSWSQRRPPPRRLPVPRVSLFLFNGPFSPKCLVWCTQARQNYIIAPWQSFCTEQLLGRVACETLSLLGRLQFAIPI